MSWCSSSAAEELMISNRKLDIDHTVLFVNNAVRKPAQNYVLRRIESDEIGKPN